MENFKLVSGKDTSAPPPLVSAPAFTSIQYKNEFTKPWRDGHKCRRHILLLRSS